MDPEDHFPYHTSTEQLPNLHDDSVKRRSTREMSARLGTSDIEVHHRLDAFRPMLVAREDIFAPWVLADRLAFLLLASYFFFWPVWYASEGRLTFRVGGLRTEYLAVLVIVALSLGTLIRAWSRAAFPSALILLIIYGAMTLTWSLGVREGCLILFNLGSAISFTQILAGRLHRQRIARMSLLLGLMVMAIIGLYRAEMPADSYFPLLFPMGIDPNQFATQLAVAALILLALAVSNLEQRPMRAGHFCVSLILCLSVFNVVVLSGSRTGVLASVVGCSILLLFRWDESKRLRIAHRRFIWLPALILIVVVAAWPLIMTSGSASLRQRYKEGFFKGDLAGRDMLWRAGIKYFGSSAKIVFIGGGLGSFGESVVDYLDAPLYTVAVNIAAENPERNEPYFAPHNDLLRIACDLGLVGLSLFIAFHVWMLKRTRAAAAENVGVLPLALLAATVISGLAIDWVNFPIYPIILANIIAPGSKLARSDGQKRIRRSSGPHNQVKKAQEN